MTIKQMGGYFVLTLFVFLFDAVDGVDVLTVSVMEGEAVTLFPDVNKQQHDKMLWYFNDTLIALINGESSKSCVYYGEGEIFRGRLKVNHETGSLTVQNIGLEHIGRYEANFIQSKSTGTSHSLNRNGKCDGTKTIRKVSNIGDSVKTFIVSVTAPLPDPDKITKEMVNMKNEREPKKKSVPSLSLITAICAFVVVVLPLAVVVMYYHYRRSNKEDKKEEGKKSLSDHLLKVSI